MLKDSHLEGREILSTHYRYDKLNRLIQAHNAHSELRFGYDHNRLVKEQLIHLDEPLRPVSAVHNPKMSLHRLPNTVTTYWATASKPSCLQVKF
ncbi:hypothetical protein KCG53_09690 [Neisseria subflava]|uniref:RHS repeat protein n=1 Tax=Neisseria subflava TaxID=28449 RepID=A0A9X9N6N6_NEISU|nr:hypothetical protein KCG53_09690 [Neisseria subflava]